MKKEMAKDFSIKIFWFGFNNPSEFDKYYTLLILEEFFHNLSLR